MFKIGERAFHPLYGVVHIENIEQILIGGEDLRLYVIYVKGTKIMVPTRANKDIGLRSLMKSRAIDKILSQTNNKSDEIINMDWNERFKMNEEKIKKGEFNELLEVVRNLYWVEKEIGLNRKEKEMYKQVHTFLVDELALAKQLSKTNSAKQLNKALWDKGK